MNERLEEVIRRWNAGEATRADVVEAVTDAIIQAPDTDPLDQLPADLSLEVWDELRTSWGNAAVDGDILIILGQTEVTERAPWLMDAARAAASERAKRDEWFRITAVPILRTWVRQRQGSLLWRLHRTR